MMFISHRCLNGHTKQNKVSSLMISIFMLPVVCFHPPNTVSTVARSTHVQLCLAQLHNLSVHSPICTDRRHAAQIDALTW